MWIITYRDKINNLIMNIGPFRTMEDAKDYADKFCQPHVWSVYPLYKPKEY